MSEAARVPPRIKFCPDCGKINFAILVHGGQLFLRCATCRRMPGIFREGVLIRLAEAAGLQECEAGPQTARIFHEELKL